MNLEAPRRLSVAVGLATRGRPEILRDTVALLAAQERPADHIFIAAADRSDVGDDLELASPHSILIGPAGLTRQRNTLLKAASDFDVIVFFDDDFYPAATYLAEVELLFASRPEVVLATGHVIADGIKGPGLAPARAREVLHADSATRYTAPETADTYNVYGCNFAVRIAAVDAGRCTFDEELPLYGWLEDVDFSRRLSSRGAIVRSTSMRGVHLGVKSGRQSGLRLGYSQIANPLHLVRKGTFAPHRACAQMMRNLAMNLVFSCAPEPYVDRWGRLKGNIKALEDAVRRRDHPERILTM